MKIFRVAFNGNCVYGSPAEKRQDYADYTVCFGKGNPTEFLDRVINKLYTKFGYVASTNEIDSIMTAYKRYIEAEN